MTKNGRQCSDRAQRRQSSPTGPGLSAVEVLAALVLAGCSASAPTEDHAATAAGTVKAAEVALAGHTSTAGVTIWAPWPHPMHDGRHPAATPAHGPRTGPRTGQLRWTRKLEGNVTPGPFIGKAGIVYAASNAGVLHAIDPATGADRWTYDGHASCGSDLSTSPAVLPDGTILRPGPNATLYG